MIPADGPLGTSISARHRPECLRDRGRTVRHHCNLKQGKRRGSVAVLIAIALIAIISIVAISIDGGVLIDDPRKVQAAADAAALAAAADLYNQLLAGVKGNDASGTAAASARTTAAGNGYDNDGTTNLVTVNIPPKSGN